MHSRKFLCELGVSSYQSAIAMMMLHNKLPPNSMVYDQKYLFTYPQVSGLMEVTLLHTEGLQVTWDLLISAELSSRL